MEKEAVLQWLKSVQTATLAEESDGGLLNPDKLIANSSYDPTKVSFLQNPKDQACSSQPFQQTQSKDTSQVQFSINPSSSSKRKIQLTRSWTLSNERTKDTGIKLKKIPSFDVFECDRDEHSIQESCIKLCQSSQSPFLASNPEMSLPTIALTQPSPRKPLVKRSSATFLSELKTLQPQLLLSSKVGYEDLPERGRSAPSSPNLQNSRKSGGWNNLSILSSASKCYSQGDVRQLARIESNDENSYGVDNSDGDSGSCMAEKGGLSDNSSSGDVDMPWGIVSSKKTVLPRGLADDGDLRMESPGCDDTVLRNAAEDRLLMENTSSLHPTESLAEEALVQRLPRQTSPRRRRFPLARQATVESNSSPQLGQFMDRLEPVFTERSEVEGSRLSPKRTLLERSASVKKQPDNPHSSICSSDHLSSLGVGSLAFHDHHLGRKTSHGFIKSNTLDDYSLKRESSPISPKSQQLSSLLGNTRITPKSKPHMGGILHSDILDQKLKAGSASVGWLSKGEFDEHHLSDLERMEMTKGGYS